MSEKWGYVFFCAVMALTPLFASNRVFAGSKNPQGIYSFCAGIGCDAGHKTIGYEPEAFVAGPDGAYYGTTTFGNTNGSGGIYRIDFAERTMRTIYPFPAGYKSSAWLKTIPDGYVDGGYTRFDPSSGQRYEGLFRVSLAGEFTVLHEAESLGFSCNAPVQDSRGNLVGVVANIEMAGTGPDFIYKISPDGAFKVVYTLPADQAFGCPDYAPVLAADGNLYGVVVNPEGGSGAIYRLAPDDTFTTVHTFPSRDDDSPTTALTIGSDGALYGLHTSSAHTRNFLYRMSLDGQFTNVGFFRNQHSHPTQKLILMPDGYLYGMARYSYTTYADFIYRFSPTGEYAVVDAKYSSKSQSSATYPLSRGFGNVLYGTTSYGGIFGDGSLYRYVPPPVQ